MTLLPPTPSRQGASPELEPVKVTEIIIPKRARPEGKAREERPPEASSTIQGLGAGLKRIIVFTSAERVMLLRWAVMALPFLHPVRSTGHDLSKYLKGFKPRRELAVGSLPCNTPSCLDSQPA